MKKTELVIIPAPLVGHIFSIVELAKLLLDRDDRLSITVLVINHPLDPTADTLVDAVLAADPRIRHFRLPGTVPPPPPEVFHKSPPNFISIYIKSHMSLVRDAIVKDVLSSGSRDSLLAGIVFDFFCSSMVDVAKELGVPSYLFFTSGAAFLGLNLDFAAREKEYTLSDPDTVVSTFACPIPARALPMFAFIEEGFKSFAEHGRKFEECDGMVVNTFEELEPYAIKALLSDPDLPPVYAVGPMLSPQKHHAGKEEILDWLSQQPPSSVVFLCFGSQGGFEAPQICQIATALEGSGHRFLWSIRRPISITTHDPAGEVPDFDKILPEGFAERTRGRGMVCGWAPQLEVLAHGATAAFVSHCGWNSVLESAYHGVPIVTWPIYAEQQPNAFLVAKELGLAVELTLDYRRSEAAERLIMAEDIENAIRSVMDEENPVKKRAKEIGEIGRKALMGGGSSSNSLDLLIRTLLKIPK